MSEAKPFEPTAARLERARREGDVLRSADLTAVAAFGCAAATVPLLAGPLAGTLRVALFDAARADLAGSAYATMAALVACVPLAAGAGALVAALVAAGGLHLRFPAARFERLDPRAGLRRILSRETLLSALKAVLATLALALVLLPVARSALAADAASAPGRLAAQTLAALERSLAVAAVA